MGVGESLSKRLVAHRRARSASRRAREAFRAAYPDKRMHMGQVVLLDDFSVVTVWWDNNMRPNARSWWRVPSQDTQTCEELTLDAVSVILDVSSVR